MDTSLEFLPIKEDPRFQDSHIVAMVRHLADVSGWQEEGGKLIRDINGEACARTKWLPIRDWWLDRPAGVTQSIVRKAIKKFDAGKNPTKPEREALHFLADVATTENITESDLYDTAGDDVDAAEVASIQKLALETLGADELEELEERAAQQCDGLDHWQYIDTLREAVNHAIERRTSSLIETCAGDPEFSLEGETISDLEARKLADAAQAKAESERLIQETRKIHADSALAGFSLIADGGSLATQEAEQAGNMAIDFDACSGEIATCSGEIAPQHATIACSPEIAPVVKSARSQIMTRAWIIARELSAINPGSKPKDFIGQAMRQAWAESRV
jgi:hypothetical protein